MKKIALILLSLILFNCNNNNKINSFNSYLEEIEQEFAPDKSIAVFDIELDKERSRWILRGETTSLESKNAVLSSTKSILENTDFQDSIIVLPHPALGADTLAVVNVSVANLRRNPSVADELIDQVIMGDRLRVLKKERSFYLVQTDYGYLGWITGYSIEQKLADSEWFTNSMGKIMALNSIIYSEPDTESDLISDVVINSKIHVINNSRKWTNVRLPDGRKGYIPNKDIELITNKFKEISIDELLNTAKNMLGIPYLWGGNSSKMNDCSGFTQIVFLANDIALPRDARQQALIGTTVNYDSTFQDVMPGDLLFFGSDKRITHVGISLGDYEFIHQDGFVMINSFNKNDENFSEHRKNVLQIIKRII